MESLIAYTLLTAIATLAFKFLALHADRAKAAEAAKRKAERDAKRAERQQKHSSYLDSHKHFSAAYTASKSFIPC